MDPDAHFAKGPWSFGLGKGAERLVYDEVGSGDMEEAN
jgi:hypothetical protein